MFVIEVEPESSRTETAILSLLEGVLVLINQQSLEIGVVQRSKASTGSSDQGPLKGSCGVHWHINGSLHVCI